MQKLLIVAVFIVCLFSTTITVAQTDTIIKSNPPAQKHVLCQIIMLDGSIYKGFIEKQTDSVLYVKGGSGVLIHVPKHQVSSIDFVNGHTTKDSVGNITFHIPAISHNYYVASSNAFLLKKGEVYGSSTYFLLWNINYAINQNFSIGVSSSILAAPIAIRLKSNFELSHKLYLGLDGVFGSGSWINSNSYGGGGVVKLTYGDAKSNFTILGGYGDIDYYMQARRNRRGGRKGIGHYENYNSVIIGGACSYAISQKIYFVAEAFAAPQVNLITVSPAIRTNIRQNISWVIGIEGVLNTRNGASTPLFAIPYIGFSFRL